MSTVSANSVLATAPGGGPLIRRNFLDEQNKGGFKRFLMLLPALGISFILHAGLFGAMFLFMAGTSGEAAPLEVVNRERKEEANVQPEAPPPPPSEDPLMAQTIDPSALDPDIDLGYAVDREAEVNVPGIVNLDVPIGIEGGNMAAPPMDIPPPAGVGPGTGGGISIEGFDGTAGAAGTVGGVNLGGGDLVKDPFGGPRGSGATKKKVLVDGGGSDETEAAVMKGLKWLKKIQSPDGAFRLDGPFKDQGSANDIAGTGFGLLPFLGGHTHLEAKDENQFDKPVLKGLAFLLRNQNPSTGDFGGGMYAHAIATYALCEAYGMTNDPKLRVPAQKAVNYLLNSQHSAGGWRYGPGQAGDTSVTGWVIQAIKAGKMAKLYVPEQKWRLAQKFMDSCQANDGYSYTPEGGATPTMSAVGLLCRYFLQNWGANNLSYINGIQKHIKPLQPGATKNMYYYYYATQVMYQFGGNDWKNWNAKMRDTLLKGQKPDGSWDPIGGHSAGRLMETSLSILTLEVYYRYLPTYLREKGYRQDTMSVGS